MENMEDEQEAAIETSFSTLESKCQSLFVKHSDLSSCLLDYQLNA